jgi:hypothetical protein
LQHNKLKQIIRFQQPRYPDSSTISDTGTYRELCGNFVPDEFPGQL